MTEQLPLDHQSPAVQKHLEIMQGVINRMTENSSSCKVWCVPFRGMTPFGVAEASAEVLQD